MYSENENLVLSPMTADETTSIKEKISVFNKMSIGLIDQYETLFEESSELRNIYDSY